MLHQKYTYLIIFHQLDVAVTPIASAEQKFQASGKLNGQTAVSGIDLTMVKVEEKNEISLEKIEEPIKIAYFYLTQPKKRKG